MHFERTVAQPVFVEPMKIDTGLMRDAGCSEVPQKNPLSPTLQRSAWSVAMTEPAMEETSPAPALLGRGGVVRPPPGLQAQDGTLGAPSLLARRTMQAQQAAAHFAAGSMPASSLQEAIRMMNAAAELEATADAKARRPSNKVGTKQQPKAQEPKAQAPEEPMPQTTVMMRNIPSEYTRSMFLDLLDSAGFAGCYDMVYLPINHRKGTAFGYAFVNMTTTEAAVSLMDRFQGFMAWRFPSDKVCEVSWSNALQGLAAHIERYRDSPMMKAGVPDEFKPAIFSQGRRIAFPGPTRGVKAPRAAKHSKEQAASGVKTPSSTAAQARRAQASKPRLPPRAGVTNNWSAQPSSHYQSIPVPGAVILSI